MGRADGGKECPPWNSGRVDFSKMWGCMCVVRHVGIRNEVFVRW